MNKIFIGVFICLPVIIYLCWKLSKPNVYVAVDTETITTVIDSVILKNPIPGSNTPAFKEMKDNTVKYIAGRFYGSEDTIDNYVPSDTTVGSNMERPDTPTEPDYKSSDKDNRSIISLPINSFTETDKLSSEGLHIIDIDKMYDIIFANDAIVKIEKEITDFNTTFINDTIVKIGKKEERRIEKMRKKLERLKKRRNKALEEVSYFVEAGDPQRRDIFTRIGAGIKRMFNNIGARIKERRKRKDAKQSLPSKTLSTPESEIEVNDSNIVTVYYFKEDRKSPFDKNPKDSGKIGSVINPEPRRPIDSTRIVFEGWRSFDGKRFYPKGSSYTFEKNDSLYSQWHTHYLENWETTKVATCDSAGEEKQICSITSCNDTLQTRPIPQLSHNYGNWEITKAATCDSEGSKSRTCSLCLKTEKEIIPQPCYTIVLHDYAGEPFDTTSIDVVVDSLEPPLTLPASIGGHIFAGYTYTPGNTRNDLSYENCYNNADSCYVINGNTKLYAVCANAGCGLRDKQKNSQN